MNIERLPSGSYRVRRSYNGKSYSIIFDHKPMQKEAEKAINDKIGRPRQNHAMSFEDAANSYMADKSNVLSPSTLRGYSYIIKRLSDHFKSLKVDNITQIDVQREINALAEILSAKTVKNHHGFISAVLALYRPDLILNTKLPMLERNDPYIPNADELKALFHEAEGTRYLVCLYLGSLGMRRSEICALSDSDIEGNTIHIRKSMVQDQNDGWQIKDYPKTSASARDIYVPDEVIKCIEEYGLYQGHPNSISDWMKFKQDKLGMKRFSLHKLRHYFASNAHELGLSDAMIQAYGGWQTDFCMKRIYRHATESSQMVSDIMGKALFS